MVQASSRTLSAVSGAGRFRAAGHPPPEGRGETRTLVPSLPPSRPPSLSARLQGTCLPAGARSFPPGGIVPGLTDGGAPGKPRLTHRELERVGHLYRMNRVRLVGLAMRVLGYPDRDTAEGIVQDAFGKVISGRVCLPEDDDKAVGTLWGVVRKTAENRREYEKIRRGEPLEVALADDPAWGGDPGGTSWRAAERVERRAKVRDALECLPHAEREVVEMTYWGGLSRDGVAEDRGCSPETVKTLLTRGRRRMRELLGPGLGLG